MKKAMRLLSFVGVILLMAFFLIRNINKENESVEAKVSDTYTITLINATPEAGDVSIAYQDSDGKAVNTNKTTYTGKAGSIVKAYFPNGLNDGYSIYAWTLYANEVMSVRTTQNNEGFEVYETKESYALALNKNYTIYVYAKTATSHVVTFYSSYSSSKSIIGFSFAEDGQDASDKYVKAPKMDAKDFDYWSGSINNVSEDISVYPIYKATIWSVFRDYYPMFLKGLGVTLLLSVISVFCALFLGMLMCFLRLSSVPILKFISATYVEVIRGVPLLLQLLIIYVILGPTRISIGSFFTTEVISCLLALLINSGAYTAEIFRSGIQAVENGQMEAGRALGMSKWKVMFKIVMPQGIKNSLPSIGNELIAMIKETSLAVSVDASIGELMSVRKQITGSTFINLPPYIIVAIIYFIVTFSLSKLIGLLERKLAHHEQ